MTAALRGDLEAIADGVGQLKSLLGTLAASDLDDQAMADAISCASRAASSLELDTRTVLRALPVR